jgi:hypothetical protein
MHKRNAEKLQHAMKSLEDALKYTRTSEFQMLGIEFKGILIAAVVQNFGLTFGVCQQMIAQQLEHDLGKETADGLTPDGLLHLAAKEGLISNVHRWLEYVDCEHLSPSSNLALRTFEKASAFLEDAADLLYACTNRSLEDRRRVA